MRVKNQLDLRVEALVAKKDRFEYKMYLHKYRGNICEDVIAGGMSQEKVAEKYCIELANVAEIINDYHSGPPVLVCFDPIHVKVVESANLPISKFPPNPTTRDKRLKSIREKWGMICEVYVNNPNMSLAEIGKKFKITEGRVSKILDKYFGNGTPINIQFEASNEINK